MKKIIVLILITINLFAWEINTHRAIDRKAIENSQNLTSFLNASGLKNYVFKQDAINFDGYNTTYIEYIVNKDKGEKNGVSNWEQTFKYNQKYSYLKKAEPKELIEAGTILEDAVYKDADRYAFGVDGRFNNHFYDAQNDGHKLTWTPYPNVNALKWATGDTYHTETKFNHYSYGEALKYRILGFTEADPKVRKKYQAKMLVSVGHLMHMVNDMKEEV